jgi:hypothetical protein
MSWTWQVNQTTIEVLPTQLGPAWPVVTSYELLGLVCSVHIVWTQNAIQGDEELIEAHDGSQQL